MKSEALEKSYQISIKQRVYGFVLPMSVRMNTLMVLDQARYKAVHAQGRHSSTWHASTANICCEQFCLYELSASPLASVNRPKL